MVSSKILTSFLFLSLSISCFAQIEFFEGSFEEALAQAKEEDKLIFMDAYAEWCGPCKWMAQNAFQDQAVGDFFNQYFINVKMDMEKGEGPELRKKYPLRAYPTLMFIAADGELVEKSEGAKKAEDFLQLGQEMYLKHHPNPDNIETVKEEAESVEELAPTTRRYEYETGYLECHDGKNWTENDNNQTVLYQYEQEREDEYFVYIIDHTRNVQIALPQRTGNCLIKIPNGWVPLFEVKKI